jgi:hypothetical protein
MPRKKLERTIIQQQKEEDAMLLETFNKRLMNLRNDVKHSISVMQLQKGKVGTIVPELIEQATFLLECIDATRNNVKSRGK